MAVVWTFFLSSIIFLSPSLWETARYRLKYCLKGQLSPKQPTNQSHHSTHSTPTLTPLNSAPHHSTQLNSKSILLISNSIPLKFHLPLPSHFTPTQTPTPRHSTPCHSTSLYSNTVSSTLTLTSTQLHSTPLPPPVNSTAALTPHHTTQLQLHATPPPLFCTALAALHFNYNCTLHYSTPQGGRVRVPPK